MNPWSASELLQGYVDLAPDVHNVHVPCSRPFLGNITEHQLWHLRNEFGVSPRTLVLYAGTPAEYENFLSWDISRRQTLIGCE